MSMNGGEAAEQVVRMALSGGEIGLRLTGSALKNVAAFLLAALKNRQAVYGKLRMGKLLKQTRDLRSFTMTRKQFKAFKKKAKPYKLLYAGVKGRGRRGLVDVILPTTELERANQVFAKIKFAPENEVPQVPMMEDSAPKKESRSGRGSRDTKDKSYTNSRGGGMRNERVSVEKRLIGYQEQQQKQAERTRPRSRKRPKGR